MKVVGYARVSTNEQAETGISLAAQEQKIHSCCELNDWECVEVIRDDGYSAKDLRRPGLKRILEELPLKKSRFDGIVVTRLDRLTRSVRDLVRLTELTDEHKVALVSIQEAVDTGTATGKMFRSIVTAINEWERDIIAERTREVLAYKRRNGERIGTIPYGFGLAEDGKRLVPVPEEMKVLRRIQKERDSGTAFWLIADGLNADLIPSKSGRTWWTATVRSVLETARRREAVSGDNAGRSRRGKTSRDRRTVKRTS